MLYNSSTATVKFLAREFSFASRPAKSRPLNRDEFSDHLLRDLGLLDGHAVPEHSERHRLNRAVEPEQIVQTRYGA
ncbi:hypothetical protein [Arvimicrobium flavum]|uniref:hypothetical protein n=1 Tax=Arvimicrobium flavum TaxID=3393320 RepID=UPI00237BA676|nr:hypothetical protein [Mesorhizobium shangrilense]